MVVSIRSRRVRRILRLHAEATRWAARLDKARSRVAVLTRRVESHRAEAAALERGLSDPERAALGRGRVGGP